MSLAIALPTTIEDSSHSSSDELLGQLATAEGRRIIFFDESIDTFIIYNGTTADLDRSAYSLHINASILPSYIVENREVESFAKAGTSGPDSINFSILDATLDATNILYNEINEKNEHCIIWKVEIPITYPRKKFSNPRLLVKCRLSDVDRPQESSTSNEELAKSVVVEPMTNYLASEAGNLLSELHNSVSLEGSGKPLELSSAFVMDPETSIKHGNGSHASTISEVAEPQNSTSPTSSVDTSAGSSTLTASFNVPVSVSLVIKLRSTKPAGRNNILLATLNIESSDELNKFLTTLDERESDDLYFKILNLELDFISGTVKEFRTKEYNYPIRFKFGDSINLTYKLLNNEFLDKELKRTEPTNNSQFSKPLNVKLILQIEKKVDGKYMNKTNIITTHWCPYLDFNIIAPPINNALKTSNNYSQIQSQSGLQKVLNSTQSNGVNGGAPMVTNPRKSALLNNFYKTTAPSNISAQQLGITYNKRLPTSMIGSSASSVTVNLTTNTNSTLSGLKLTFVGKLNIKLGEIVNWKIQAINDSKNRLKLSLIVQNPLNFSPIYNANSIPVTSSNENVPLSSSSGVNVLHTRAQLLQLYYSLKLKTSGVIILNNDIRIGPMDPNTVYETNIMLVGLSKGMFNLDGIKIFDISSGDGLDFGKLVEVFVVE